MVDKNVEAKRFAFIAFGSLIYAFFMNIFIVPASMYSGGFMGLAQIIRTLLVDYAGIEFGHTDIAGILYFFINVPIFLFARRSLGNMYIVRTMANIIFETIFLTLIPTPAAIIESPLTCVLIGGIGTGLGSGIAVRNGSSGGGTELIGMVFVKSHKNLKMSTVSNTINLLVFGLMLAVFNIEKVVYSAIYSVIFIFTYDRIYIQNINVEVHIITSSEFSGLIRDGIFKEIERGITKWNCIGAYTGDTKDVLYVLTNKYEIPRLKQIVLQYDKHAMIIENSGVMITGNFEKRIL